MRRLSDETAIAALDTLTIEFRCAPGAKPCFYVYCVGTATVQAYRKDNKGNYRAHGPLVAVLAANEKPIPFDYPLREGHLVVTDTSNASNPTTVEMEES